ncbi:hypothetical protein ACKAV7_010086 [Fusarium commune]
MISQRITNDVLFKLIAKLKKVEATAKGTDDAIGTLNAAIDDLGRAVGDIGSTNSMVHDSLNRLDSRLLRIEREQQKQKQRREEAEYVIKRVQESQNRLEREERRKVATMAERTRLEEATERGTSHNRTYQVPQIWHNF